MRNSFNYTLKYFLLIITICVSPIFSHPVTFKGGYAFSLQSSNLLTEGYINKSFSKRYSLGLQGFHLGESNETLGLLQYNYLLKRWYFHDAQANIYTTASLGWNNTKKTLFPCIHMKADAENRRIFSSVSATIMKPSHDYFLKIVTRLGLAPYKHQFSGVSTWFMLEASYLEYRSNQLQFMPIYRGFYKSVLWELGTNGTSSFFHFMIHY